MKRATHPAPHHISAMVARKLAAMRPVLACAVLLAAAPASAQTRYGLSQSENDRFLADLAARPGIQKLEGGVLYRVLASGAGAAPASRSDKVSVSYSGVLINGTRFGASEPGKPSVFTISRTIRGWQGALMQMKEGDRWEVIVPADLAYGGGSAGLVPPDQTLVFTLTLNHVEHAS
jgi:FKBP-type peptidyl-prolyl cis-trans isomerase FklB